jgi:hypothetical protein
MKTGSVSGPLGRPLLRGGASAASTVSVTCESALATGHFQPRHIRGMRSCWRSGHDQMMGGARVTVGMELDQQPTQSPARLGGGHRGRSCGWGRCYYCRRRSRYSVRMVNGLRFERSDDFAFDEDKVTFRGDPEGRRRAHQHPTPSSTFPTVRPRAESRASFTPARLCARAAHAGAGRVRGWRVRTRTHLVATRVAFSSSVPNFTADPTW